MQKPQKTFVSLRNHNIKKRFNIWQEELATGSVERGHLDMQPTDLESAIKTAKDYQEYSDKVEKGKYVYHVDIEILIENSEGESLMEDGDIAYAITVYPEVNDFCKEVEVW